MVEKGDTINSREAILLEIENWKQNLSDGFTWHSELNNFHTYLPSDDYSDSGGRQIGYMALVAGLMDIKNSESHKETLQILHHSRLFLDQTPREYFEEIDKTINGLPGISLMEIKRLQHEHFKFRDIHLSQNMSLEEEKQEMEKIDKSIEILHALYEYCLPVYVELRVKGYSHFDLTG